MLDRLHAGGTYHIRLTYGRFFGLDLQIAFFSVLLIFGRSDYQINKQAKNEKEKNHSGPVTGHTAAALCVAVSPIDETEPEDDKKYLGDR